MDALEGEGLIALAGSTPVAIVSWMPDPDGTTAEIRAVAVAAPRRRRGLARSLMAAAHERLRRAGVRRAWLVTTNDNRAALALYEELGYRLVEIREGAIAALRRTIKPSIPLVNDDGVPIRDELELDVDLGNPASQ